jgi:single-stranded-DNA-specific exonuclease
VWQVAPPFDGAADLARQLNTAPMVAQLLHNRGVTDVEAARKFLDPKLTHLHDPGLLEQIDVAAERILRAVRDGEKITLYGDYDVDGMTGHYV